VQQPYLRHSEKYHIVFVGNLSHFSVKIQQSYRQESGETFLRQRVHPICVICAFSSYEWNILYFQWHNKNFNKQPLIFCKKFSNLQNFQTVNFITYILVCIPHDNNWSIKYKLKYKHTFGKKFKMLLPKSLQLLGTLYPNLTGALPLDPLRSKKSLNHIRGLGDDLWYPSDCSMLCVLLWLAGPTWQRLVVVVVVVVERTDLRGISYSSF